MKIIDNWRYTEDRDGRKWLYTIDTGITIILQKYIDRYLLSFQYGDSSPFHVTDFQDELQVARDKSVRLYYAVQAVLESIDRKKEIRERTGIEDL